MTDVLKEKLESQGVNIEETLERFVGMDSLYIKFLKKFPEDKNFKLLEDSITGMDMSNAFTAAHTLKGVAGNLGFGQLFEALVPFVETLREGDLNTAKTQMPAITRMYESICQIIHDELND